MLGVRGKTAELVHFARDGLKNRSTSLQFMCANVGIDFFTGRHTERPQGEIEALDNLRESSIGVVEQSRSALQSSMRNETWYADLNESEWTLEERTLEINRITH
jgi:hypothetical protein